jgi:ATP-dependent Clp protease ATP-binding subunit ClpA
MVQIGVQLMAKTVTRLNLDSLKEAMDLKVSLREWMKEKGYDPAKGGRLLVNTKMREIFKDMLTSEYVECVIVNNLLITNNPVLVNTADFILGNE